MNDHIYLHFWGKKISIFIDDNCDEIRRYLLQVTHISGIPVRVEVLPYSKRELKDPALCIIASDVPKLEFSERTQTLDLAISWQLIENKISSLNNIIGQLISLACVNSHEFPIHSSVVAKDGQAYLILGTSGAGKTNLSLALCKRRDFLWLANDWSALRLERNNVLVSQGYDLINFRTASINQIAGCLPVPVIEQIQYKHGDAMDFSRKSGFYHSDEIEIQKADLPLSISRIYVVQIVQNDEKKISQFAPNEIIDKLTYEFFWVLRGLGSFLISKSSEVILPSVVMRPLIGWKPMCKVVNVLAGQCPMYYVNSNLDTAIQFISSKNQ